MYLASSRLFQQIKKRKMPFYAMQVTFAQVYIGFFIQIYAFDFTETPSERDTLWSTVINRMVGKNPANKIMFLKRFYNAVLWF